MGNRPGHFKHRGTSMEPNHHEVRVTAERILWNFRSGGTSLRDPALANLALAYGDLLTEHSALVEAAKEVLQYEHHPTRTSLSKLRSTVAATEPAQPEEESDGLA